MCHGHPHHHPCGHQSVTWHYCPKAAIDLSTGYETPCEKATFAASQPSHAECPLQHCEFKSLGGSWTCCRCKQGPNTMGWCTNKHPTWIKNHISDEWEWIESCDHGCCKNCTKYPPGSSTTTEGSSSERRKGSSSRSKHSHSHKSKSSSSATTSSGYGGGYDLQLDYAPKKKHSSHKKK